jgi:hypothetical protein
MKDKKGIELLVFFFSGRRDLYSEGVFSMDNADNKGLPSGGVAALR